MQPTWSLKNEILKRAKRESDYAWAISNTTPEIPKYEKQPKIKFSVGLYNFWRTYKPLP